MFSIKWPIFNAKSHNTDPSDPSLFLSGNKNEKIIHIRS